MSTEGDHPARLRHQQRRALARYLRYEVAAYSPSFRAVLQRAGVAGRTLRDFDDLRRIPPTQLAEITDPASVVLRPTQQAAQREGPLRHRWATVAARVAGVSRLANHRVFEPAYQPVLWLDHGGFPVASSAEDLDRLAEHGRRWLDLAGVRRRDVIVSLLPVSASLAFWELSLGCRRGGVGMMPLEPGTPADRVVALGPTVLVGEVDELLRLLGERDPETWAGVGTILAVGEPLEPAIRARLRRLAGGGAVVVAAWAPPGVRALWAECRGGAALHLAPTSEYVDTVDPETGRPVATGRMGEVIWTPIGWRGTVVPRLATGVWAVADSRPCGTCGRVTPRLWPVLEPSFVAVLAEHPEVADWQVTRTLDGLIERDVAAIALTDGRRRARVLADIAAEVPGLVVEVVSRREIDRRIDDAGGEQIIDQRG